VHFEEGRWEECAVVIFQLIYALIAGPGFHSR